MNNKITLFLALLFFTVFNVTFAQDGANDPTFNPGDAGYGIGADFGISSLSVQNDGKIIISGYFRHYSAQDRSFIARINGDKSLDTTFNVGTGANDVVATTAIQPDGKILIAGSFTAYNGTAINKIARLNVDGSLDTTFNAFATIGVQNYISKIILQPDGKIVVCENANFDPVMGDKISRLNSDGSTDTTFTPGLANHNINTIVMGQDGKIIAGGSFTVFNGIPLNKLIRLRSDGSIDTEFNPVFNGDHIDAVGVQDDGKVYTAGITYTDNVGTSSVMRFNTNGTSDDTFTTFNTEDNQPIFEISILPNGKFIIAGGVLSRRNTDGSIDTAFNNVDLDGSVGSVAVLPDDELLLGGNFFYYDYNTENFIVKIDADGTVDPSFSLGNGTGADDQISNIISLPNGKMVVTGYFKHYNGVARNSIARITEDGLLDEGFNPDISRDHRIYTAANAPGGKLLVARVYLSNSGNYTNELLRLNIDGTLDTSFSTGLGFEYPYPNQFSPLVVNVQQDGKIIVGGNITSYNGVPCAQVIRLNTDGSIDATFNIPPTPPSEFGRVNTINILPNGKILLVYGGLRTGLLNIIVKLNSDGSQDTSFTAITTDILREIDCFAIQPNGKIIAHGYYFYNELQMLNYRFARFNADGTLDTVFMEGEFFSGPIFQGIYPQQDGRIILSGVFDSDTDLQKYLIRLNSNGSRDETFISQPEPGASILSIVPQMDKLVIAGYFRSFGRVGRNRIARVMNSGSMGTKTQDAISNDVIAYRKNSILQISSFKEIIKGVQVYDVSGRLLSDAQNINALKTSIEDIIPSHKILIVNIKLANNTTVSKKIYY